MPSRGVPNDAKGSLDLPVSVGATRSPVHAGRISSSPVAEDFDVLWHASDFDPRSSAPVRVCQACWPLSRSRGSRLAFGMEPAARSSTVRHCAQSGRHITFNAFGALHVLSECAIVNLTCSYRCDPLVLTVVSPSGAY